MSEPFRLYVRITIEQPPGPRSAGRLEVSEETRLEVKTFLDVAAVLGKFHELTESLKPREVDDDVPF